MSFDRHLTEHSFVESFDSVDDACVCLRIASRFAPREVWQLYAINCQRPILAFSCQLPILIAEVVNGKFIQRSF